MEKQLKDHKEELKKAAKSGDVAKISDALKNQKKLIDELKKK